MARPAIGLAGALSLGVIALPAFACDLPKLPVIPASADVGDRAAEVSAATSAYFEGIRAYVACLQSELAAAGGDSAPPSVKAVLVARTDAAVAEAEEIQALYQERVGAGQTATSGTENAARKLIAGLASGMPDYDSMTPELARLTRQQLSDLRRDTAALGAIVGVDFMGVGSQGNDIYQFRGENRSMEVRIGLDGDGKIAFALLRPLGARTTRSIR